MSISEASPSGNERSPTPARRSYREVRFFGVFRESPALHVHLMQAVGFAYLGYRFASRNYTVFGALPDEAFIYPRVSLVELFPVPVSWITTGQFIYGLVPRPGPDAMAGLQFIVIAACLSGLLGIAPRLMAWVAFAIATHVTGMVVATGADVDGGSLVLCLVLILALSPASNFYRLGRPLRISHRSTDHHWPVFLLMLVVGAFYTFSGLGKLIDIGPTWPLRLHLDNLEVVAVERSLFLAERYSHPLIAKLALSPSLSVIGGVVTLIGELGFLSILWLPRFRPFFVASMAGLHLLIFYTAAINFVGSIAVLILCLDWNVLARRATVVYDGTCGFCRRSIGWVMNRAGASRLEPRAIDSLTGQEGVDRVRLDREMAVVDEWGEVYYGADAFEQIGKRVPMLMPFAALMSIPGVAPVARAIYRRIALHRRWTLGID